MIEKVREIPRNFNGHPYFIEHSEKINEIIDVLNFITRRVDDLFIDHGKEQPSLVYKKEQMKEKTTGLTFEEAMVFLRQGKRMKRAAWKSRPEDGGCISKSLCGPDSEDKMFTSHLFENDWEVIDG